MPINFPNFRTDQFILFNFYRRLITVCIHVLPSDARSTMTLASMQFASFIQGSNRIAVALLTAFATYYVVVAIFTLIAIAPLYIRFATTFSRNWITHRWTINRVLFGTWGIALASCAISFWQRQCIPIKTLKVKQVKD